MVVFPRENGEGGATNRYNTQKSPHVNLACKNTNSKPLHKSGNTDSPGSPFSLGKSIMLVSVQRYGN